MSKTCSKCGEIKPEEEFYWRSPKERGRRKDCKLCVNQRSEDWKKRNPDKAKQSRQKWIDNNPDKRKKARLVYYQGLKAQAFAAYGDCCSCCGEREPRFLAFDHIRNDGAKHRKDDRISGGLDFLRWLKRNNYPDNIQVLCHNCNVGKHLNGGVCPHEQS